MRTAVAETSLEAHRSLKVPDLQRREAEIMALFGPATRLSRQQISEMARRPLCGVCGRIDSLIAKGWLVEEGRRVDPSTGRAQKLLRLPGGQVEMGFC